MCQPRYIFNAELSTKIRRSYIKAIQHQKIRSDVASTDAPSVLKARQKPTTHCFTNQAHKYVSCGVSHVGCLEEGSYFVRPAL